MILIADHRSGSKKINTAAIPPKTIHNISLISRFLMSTTDATNNMHNANSILTVFRSNYYPKKQEICHILLHSPGLSNGNSGYRNISIYTSTTHSRNDDLF